MRGWHRRAGRRRGEGATVGSVRPRNRAALAGDRRITGLSSPVLAALVAEVGPQWQARCDARLADRPHRKRAVGAGAKHRLVFVDRLLATLVHLRHGVTHDVLAAWFGVHRSTITRAVGEVRPLLAARGCTVEDGVRGAPWPTWWPTREPSRSGRSSTPPTSGCAARPPAGPGASGSCRPSTASTPPRRWC